MNRYNSFSAVRVIVQTLIFLLLMPISGAAQKTELSVQTGHVAPINKIVFSPDGNLLASSDDHNKVCIWDMSVLMQMSAFFYSDLAEGEIVSLLAISPDNNSLVAGTPDGKLLVWDIGRSLKIAGISTGAKIRDLIFIDNKRCLLMADPLLCLDLSENSVKEVYNKKIGDVQIDRQKEDILYCTFDGETGTISYSSGFSVKKSDSQNTDLTRVLSGKNPFIIRMKLGKNSVAVAGSMNIKFFSLPDQVKSFSVSTPYMDDKITDLEFIPQSNFFLASNTDGQIYIYDFSRGKLVRSLKDHISGVNTLAMHPSRNIFASGSADRSIILWDAISFRQIKRFYARAASIGCIDLSGQNQLLAFGNELGYTKLLKLSDKNPEIIAVKNHRQKVNDLLFVNDGTNIITCSDDNHVTRINAGTMEMEKRKKFKSDAAPKYIFTDLVEKFNFYVNPYMFVDSLTITKDHKGVIANGHFRQTKFFSSKKYDKQYKFLYTISDFKKSSARKVEKEHREKIPVDTLIFGINVYNREYGHISAVTDAAVDTLQRRLITSSQDATLKMWDLDSKNLIMTIIPVDKDKRVFITPDNYYFAPKNSLDAIGFKQGKTFYPPEQFDLKFNRPDIVLQRMGYSDSVLIRMYRKAYEKRLKKAGFDEKMFTPEWHTPEVSILNSSETGYSTDQPELKVDIKGSDTRYNLDRINVWVNDVPIFGTNGISLRSEKTNSIGKSLSIPLSAGENSIKFSAMNEKGIESLRASKDIIYTNRSAVKPDLYVISVSVSEYKDDRYNLQYSVKDGRDIASMFAALPVSAGEYNRIIIDTLFNKNATRENFYNLRGKLLKTKVDDQVILFVSGHGLLNKDLDFYFATYDIDFSNPELKGISFDNMESLLDSIPARKKLMMMDACHSGEVDKEEPVNLIAQNVEASADITFRGNIKEYNFRGTDKNAFQSGVSLDNTFEIMQELFAGLDKGTGTVVISAAAGKGYALESAKWNNGVFTYSILNGLKNKAADKNSDKKITVTELKDYSITQVEQLTGGKQKPTARRESIGVDWRIW